MWLNILGPLLYEDSKLVLPLGDIFKSLGLFILCLVAGLIIRYWWNSLAVLIGKIHRAYAAFYLVFILTFGMYVNAYAFEMLTDWRVALSAMLLPYTATAFAATLGFIVRQPKERVMTIAIETALQNGAVALVLVDKCLTSPADDLAAVLPVLCTVFAPLPWWSLLFIKGYYDKCACLKPRALYYLEEEEDAVKVPYAVSNDPHDPTSPNMSGFAFANPLSKDVVSYSNGEIIIGAKGSDAASPYNKGQDDLEVNDPEGREAAAETNEEQNEAAEEIKQDDDIEIMSGSPKKRGLSFNLLNHGDFVI